MSDPIFQRGLQDLIKGIRSHKKDPSAFISQAMASIKVELRSTDPFLKTEAVSNGEHHQYLWISVRGSTDVITYHRFATIDKEVDVSANDRLQRQLGCFFNCRSYVADKIRA